MFFQKLLAYGLIGFLIEVVFTGISSLVRGNLKATSQTYLWMFFVYGFAGLGLEAVSDHLDIHRFLKPFFYVPVMYGVEAASGWILMKLIGANPWHYGHSKYTPFGLIHLGYAPFWLLVAFAFDPLSEYLKRALQFLAQMS